MIRLAAVVLVLACGPAVAAPPVGVPRLDPEGFPLPRESVRRLGSSRFLSTGDAAPVGHTPDGKTLVTRGSSVVGWDPLTGRARWTYEADRTAFQHAALSPGGRTVWAIATRYSQTPAPVVTEVVRLSAADGSRLGRVRLGGTPYVMDLAPTGRLVVQRDKRLELVDGATGQVVGSWPVSDTEYVSGVALAPDGRRAAVGIGQPGSLVRVVDLATGRLEQTLPVGRRHDRENVVPRFGADGRHLYALVNPGSWRSGQTNLDSVLHGWDLRTGAALFAFAVSADVGRGRPVLPGWLVVSPDGKAAALGGWDRPPTVYDLPGGEVRCRLPVETWTPPLFDPAGKVLVVGGLAVTQWDAATGKRLPHSAQPLGTCAGLSFSQDGGRLTVLPHGGADVVEWDVRTGREASRATWEETLRDGLPGRTGYGSPSDGPVTLRSPDGLMMARFVVRRGDFQDPENGTIILADARTRRHLRTLPRASNFTQGLAFSPDGRFLVSDVHSAAVYDTTAGRLLHTIPIATVQGENVCTSLPGSGRLYPCPDGRRLAVLEVNSFSTDQEKGRWSRWEVGVYDLPTGKEVKRFRGEGVLSSLCWSADGSRLAAAGEVYYTTDGKKGLVFVGDLTTEHPPLPPTRAGRQAFAVALSPDGRTLAVSDEQAVRLWEVASGKVRHAFAGHRSAATCLAFSPDGRRLASSAADGTLVWDVAGELSRPPADLDRAWADLGSDDAGVAFRAARRLAADPDRALPLMARQFAAAAPKPDAGRVPELIRQLDAPSFADREQAQAELTRLGPVAAAALRTAAESGPTSEVRDRAKRVLATPARTPPEALRAVRAVEAVSWVGTPAAIGQLQRWARGPAHAPLTAEATRAAERLTR